MAKKKKDQKSAKLAQSIIDTYKPKTVVVQRCIVHLSP